MAPEQSAAAQARGACIVTPHPYLYFARLTQLWKRHLRAPQAQRVASVAPQSDNRGSSPFAGTAPTTAALAFTTP